MTNSRTRRDILRRSGVGLAVSAGFAGCLGTASEQSRPASASETPLIVGSKNFTENVILGYMSYEVLQENTDIPVEARTNYGNNAKTYAGFRNRDFHTYWTYVGTMWLVDEPRNEEPIRGPDEQYQALKTQMEDRYDIRILDRTSFENTYVFFTSPAFARQTGIETISDLAAAVNSGTYDITVAVEDDFSRRNDGWPALTDHYGFEDERVDEWRERGGLIVVDPGLGYDELRFGTADIALGYSTNALLEEMDVVILDDDQNFWPHYHLIPVLAAERASDTVVTELNKLPDVLDSAETMQWLNARVDLQGETPQQVAQSFLTAENVI